MADATWDNLQRGTRGGSKCSSATVSTNRSSERPLCCWCVMCPGHNTFPCFYPRVNPPQNCDRRRSLFDVFITAIVQTVRIVCTPPTRVSLYSALSVLHCCAVVFEQSDLRCRRVARCQPSTTAARVLHWLRLCLRKRGSQLEIMVCGPYHTNHITLVTMQSGPRLPPAIRSCACAGS